MFPKKQYEKYISSEAEKLKYEKPSMSVRN